MNGKNGAIRPYALYESISIMSRLNRGKSYFEDAISVVSPSDDLYPSYTKFLVKLISELFSSDLSLSSTFRG